MADPRWFGELWWWIPRNSCRGLLGDNSILLCWLSRCLYSFIVLQLQWLWNILFLWSVHGFSLKHSLQDNLKMLWLLPFEPKLTKSSSRMTGRWLPYFWSWIYWPSENMRSSCFSWCRQSCGSSWWNWLPLRNLFWWNFEEYFMYSGYFCNRERFDGNADTFCTFALIFAGGSHSLLQGSPFMPRNIG